MGLGPRRQGEGGAGGWASRGRARRAPGGGSRGWGVSGLGPERGRTPSSRGSQRGRGEYCPGGDRWEAVAGPPARARSLHPPTPEVCNGTSSRPRSPWPPCSERGREELPLNRGGVSFAALSTLQFRGRAGGWGRRYWRATPSLLGPLKGPRPPRAPRRPFTLCKEPQFLVSLPRVALWSPRQGPTPAETEFNKFGQEVPDPTWLGLARRLRVDSTGSELYSARPARETGSRAPSTGLRPEPGGPWVLGFGLEALGLECVIRGAGTLAGRSGFQKCPFVMPLPGPASSPFPAPPPPPTTRAAGPRRSSLDVPLWISVLPPPVH